MSDPWKRVEELESKVRELEARIARMENRQAKAFANEPVKPGATLHLPQKGQH